MTERFTSNVPRETPAPVVHLRYSRDAARVYCGRLVARMDHVHAFADAIATLVPGGRVCRMCERARARHLRGL